LPELHESSTRLNVIRICRSGCIHGDNAAYRYGASVVQFSS